MSIDEQIALAQRKLIDACMKVPIDKSNYGVSAYVNGTLLGAQVAALVEYTAPFELDDQGTPIMKATFQEILVKHLEARAQLFLDLPKEAPRIQIAH